MSSKRRRKSVPKKRKKRGIRIVKPITGEYIRSMAGMVGTKGKLLRVLMDAKTRERVL
jgi:hypothetical protein